ncbi:MAG: guanine deaminase [Colwellia sp.]|nr:guanine deaminase [Colwellia sp.]
MITAHRASILHFLADPDLVKQGNVALEACYQYFDDGLLITENGHVKAVGDAKALLATLNRDIKVHDHTNCLIMPGFIDTHIHYPQTEMIAAYGEQLLEWLEKYTFPTEEQFEDEDYARDIAERFLDELLRAGTTTALVFGTVHKASVDAFFKACETRDLRMIAGKVMMDSNAPDNLTDTPESSYIDSKALIEKWHNKGRLRYAVTPRFSPTCSEAQLQKAGQLLSEHSDVYMHTHLSENLNEVAWVKELFPERKNYLDTYDHAGLLGKRSVFAHCIHLDDDEWQRMSDSQSNIAFCPTSNLFLGSGFFHLSRAVKQNISVGLGTDVGGGTSFSMLQTLNEAYKVLQLRGEQLSPFKGLYLATLGGAKTLDMDDLIGNFVTGKEADFIVMDKASTPLMKFRMSKCKDLFEQLFVFSMLGDDRAIKETWSAGKMVHARDK